MHKLLLYIINLLLVIWGVDAIDLSNIFKTNKPYQMRIIYIIIIFSLTYLTTNFMSDFISSFR